MSKNIPCKKKVVDRLDNLSDSTGITNYSDLIKMILDKAYPISEDSEE